MKASNEFQGFSSDFKESFDCNSNLVSRWWLSAKILKKKLLSLKYFRKRGTYRYFSLIYLPCNFRQYIRIRRQENTGKSVAFRKSKIPLIYFLVSRLSFYRTYSSRKQVKHAEKNGSSGYPSAVLLREGYLARVCIHDGEICIDRSNPKKLKITGYAIVLSRARRILKN